MFLRFVQGGSPKTLNLGNKMYAMGRLGSYITRGVYTFSGPFHPFGGAVDIVVVQQEDGSFKSSPWYVRFGKFQGVFKAKEKIVDINVNGVEANFHMYLDQRGEAFFMKEVDSEDVDAVVSPLSSSGEELDGKSLDRRQLKSMTLNYDFDRSISVIDMSNGKRLNSRRSRILGFVLGSKSMKEKRFQAGGDGSDVDRTESMERAEIAADLLEVKWSTNLASGRNRKENTLPPSGSDILNEAANKVLQTNDGQAQVDSLLQDHLVNCLDTADSHEDNAELNSEVSLKIDGICIRNNDGGDKSQGLEKMPDNGSLAETAVFKEAISLIGLDGSNGQADEIPDLSRGVSGESEEVFMLAETFHETTEIITEVSSPKLATDKHSDSLLLTSDEKFCSSNDTKILESEIISSITSNVVAETYSETVSIDPLTGVAEMESCSIFTIPDFRNSVSEVENGKNSSSEANVIQQLGESQKVVDDSVATKETPEKKEQLFFTDLDDSKLNDVEHTECKFADRIENDTHSLLEIDAIEAGNEFVQESLTIDINGRREDSKGSTNHVDIPRKCEVKAQEVGRLTKSLPNMCSQFDEYDADDLHSSSANSLGAKPRSSNWKFLREDIKSIIKLNEDKDHQLSTPQPAIIDTKELTDNSGTAAVGNPSDINDASSVNWRLWPFRRTRSRKFPESSYDCKTDSEADSIYRDVDGEKEVSKLKQKKIKVRALAPTTEQLASLNLKEGKNIVTFTFSNSVLGEQQVEARIYLWRWDTRIVISDVDGTITKSDVLGQFMPLVGRDWSQTGVAHLFSAIKENGYQLLFLSARAISQSHQTRQFLFNIKQDGKCLPDGPVVISPDGLFPSLFREVIRRAPHEFKIACLEDIKACFPTDRNPFYAGFGNRDTDEFSYLKVGIPKGKIFIINPKGEVVVNRRVDSKSYTSLHALVNSMFPPISTHEEEDYNSWNFWKLPPSSIGT